MDPASRLGASRTVVREAVKILPANLDHIFVPFEGQRHRLARGVGGDADAAVGEHEAIYPAIRDEDPKAAAQATSVHLDNPRGLPERNPAPRVRLTPHPEPGDAGSLPK
jgi:DNA-binding FadR family transcriptional regulator